MQISMTGWVGQALLWLGFLGGSFAAVLRLENEAAPWQTIPWLLYLGCTVVGSTGVVLLRREKSAQRSESAASEIGLERVCEQLHRAADHVSELEQKLADMTCEEVLEFIDDRCTPVLTEFADNRMVISNRFGTTRYASVMTEFASGERYLNRSWSAAADGYVDEVARSVGHASAFLNAANEQLEQAVRSSP